jgi:hypothetical protein
MFRHWTILLLAVTAILNAASTGAQAQKRNYNVKCGLIGNFAQYEQHSGVCGNSSICVDRKHCSRVGVKIPSQALIAAPTGSPDALGAQVNVDTGSLDASASVSVTGGTASAGASGEAGGATGEGGASIGGGGVAGGGGLGLP